MGRLSYDPQIQHFSHPHTLQLSNHHRHQQPTSLSVCSACHHPLSSGGAWIYSCPPPCGFALHASCAQLPPLITHPSHPKHPLSLLPSPAYPGGSFDCDACGRRARGGFSYHCAECQFDLHIACASKPLSVTHRLHPHALGLAFYPPYAARGFQCDVCRGHGAYHWLYRCGMCEFDAHLDCATGTATQPSPPQPQPQPQPPPPRHNSYPGAINSHLHQYPNQTAPAITGPTTQPRPPNHTMHSYGIGAVPNPQPPPVAAGGNNSLMGSASQTFVNGAADQPAQTLVQEMLSGTSGGNGSSNSGSSYGGDGGGEDSSSTSIMGVGSSILSAVFGGSSDSQDQ